MIALLPRVIFLVLCASELTRAVPNKSSLDRELIRMLSSKLFEYKKPLNFLQLPQVSQACQRDFSYYLASLTRMEFWALQMFDASANFPAGILRGNVNSFGNFQECLSIENNEQVKIKGKHCYVELQPSVNESAAYVNHLRQLIQSYEIVQSEFKDPAHIFNRFSSIIYGICVPSTCTHQDVEAYAKHIINDFIGNNTGLKIDVQVEKTMCHVANSEGLQAKMWSNGTKITIFFFSIIFGASLFSTYIYTCEEIIEDNHWLEAFSLSKNYRKLISTKRSDDDLKAIHGIKFLTAVLIFICHKTVDSLIPSLNRTEVALKSLEATSIIVRICALYTDVFLMLSGVLVAYSITNRLMMKQKISIIREYLTRYTRIIPNVIVTMLITVYILPIISHKTAHQTLLIEKPAELCMQNGWRNIFMIHNWFKFEEMCNLHTHHIGTDFELFLIAPFLLILLWKTPRRGYAIIMTMLIIASALRFYVTYTKELTYFVPFSTKLSTLIKTANYLYTLPTHRFTVYAIGLLLGFNLRKLRVVKINYLSFFLGQCVSVLAIFAIIGACKKMLGFDVQYDKFTHATFAAFAPILACIPISWIIFLSHIGYKNRIINFLEWDGFLTTTRMCYAFYLIQIPILQLLLANRRDIRYYSALSVFDLNELALVCICSMAMTLLVEMPVLNLKNMLFREKICALNDDGDKKVMNGNGVNGYTKGSIKED